MKRAAGFTLIELLVVISIFGILSSIVVVAASDARSKAALASGKQSDASLRRGIGLDLVGEWTMSACSGSEVADTSGFNNNGSFRYVGGLLAGGSWSTETPYGVGCSALFDGLTNRIRILVPNSPSLKVTGTITISAWINVSVPSDGIRHRQIVRKTKVAQDHGYLLELNAMQKIAFSSGGSSVEYNQGFPYATDGKWHFVAGSYDGTTIHMYLDGVLKISYPGDPPPNDVDDDLYIGSFQGSQFFEGLIDDVRIYSTAITASQMHSLYAMELPKYLAKE